MFDIVKKCHELGEPRTTRPTFWELYLFLVGGAYCFDSVYFTNMHNVKRLNSCSIGRKLRFKFSRFNVLKKKKGIIEASNLLIFFIHFSKRHENYICLGNLFIKGGTWLIAHLFKLIEYAWLTTLTNRN